MPLIIFAKRFILRTSDRVLSTDEGNPFNRSLASNTLLSRLWRTMLIIDSLLQVTFSVRIPMKMGTVVVCDRYIFDQMVDIAVDLRLSPIQLEIWANNSVYSLFPRPDLTFLMDADEVKAFARKTDVRSVNELRLRRASYLLLSRINRMIVIDASEEYATVSRTIRQYVVNAMQS
jgi:thymidylate kinase